MEEGLKRVLHRHFPDAESIVVEELAVIAGGYSRETYRFDAHVHHRGERRVYPMILRKDPPKAAAILHTSRQLEHDLLQRVRRHTSIPVGDSYVVEMDSATFGEAAMVIERVHGSGEPSLLFNGGPNADQAEAVATHLCELIAELHMTDPKKLNPDGVFDDPRGVGMDPSRWQSYMDEATNYYVRAYDEFAFDPMPVFKDAFLDIRRNKPRPLPITLVHGDFNPANFLYESGRVTAIIDWENSHMGDPREDLGWMAHTDLLSATDIMGSVKVDGGFLGHYNRITGFNVTPEEVEYFRLFSSGNIGVPVLAALKRRMVKEHEELLHMYIMQPAIVSALGLAQLLHYPMPAQG
jgi:aminoglycoside phosphotransferase (APT) family kinase protein